MVLKLWRQNWNKSQAFLRVNSLESVGNGRFRYLVETQFGFTIGTTNVFCEETQLDFRCSRGWNARRQWRDKGGRNGRTQNQGPTSTDLDSQLTKQNGFAILQQGDPAATRVFSLRVLSQNHFGT